MADLSAPDNRPFGADFYVTGGTLRPDAACYVERQADKELCEGLLRGEFCYVLTSRQMGKSSLMVRAVRRLRQDGAAVAVLDLTAIGQNLSIDQWYDGLLSRLGRQLDLEDELLSFTEAHPEWGPLQRWITAIEQVVLTRLTGKVVIFVDEIDIVRSLQFSTDEFFAAIREFFNRRSREPEFNRLAFGLLGVATPNDLIRDTRTTPFNIGRRIELNDFTAREAEPLAQGLWPDPEVAASLLSRVLFWTGGHPYLTQRLCRALADALRPVPSEDPAAGVALPPLLPQPVNVDRLANQLFLSRRARDQDDNLIFVRERLLRSELDVPGLLYLYRRVRSRQPTPDDETNPLVSLLRLSGIVRGVDGMLTVRNQIYAAVFDLHWIQTNMPEAEVRRQRRASRRGMVVGFGIAVFLLLTIFVFAPLVNRYAQSRLANRAAHQLPSVYQHLSSYQDTFTTSLDIRVGGTEVPITASGSLIFEEPARVNLAIKSDLFSPPQELRLLRDGPRFWVYLPASQAYQAFESPPMRPFPRGPQFEMPFPPGPTPFDLPPEVAARLGPLRILPVYRLFLVGPVLDHFLANAREFRFERNAELNGEPVRIIRWRANAAAFLRALAVPVSASQPPEIPVTAWVNTSNNLILRLSMNLDPWAKDLIGLPSDLPVTGLTITDSHSSIRAAEGSAPGPRSLARFQPPTQAQRAEQLQWPNPNLASLASPQRLLSKLIPPRFRQASPELIDLTDYYNAALGQVWHPSSGGVSGNSLDIVPGLLLLGDVIFDVRGIVQLSGRQLQADGGNYPREIPRIHVGMACRQIHFLQACGWTSPENTRIGSYVAHYADGHEATIPIVYGDDVRDWSASSDHSATLTRGIVVWRDTNRASLHIRLFKTTWVNPTPEVEISSLDYRSAMADSAPFLVALTAEP